MSKTLVERGVVEASQEVARHELIRSKLATMEVDAPDILRARWMRSQPIGDILSEGRLDNVVRVVIAEFVAFWLQRLTCRDQKREARCSKLREQR